MPRRRETNDQEDAVSNRVWRIIGKVIKYTALTCVFAVCAFMIWRIASSGDPDSMEALIVTPEIAEAYEANGENLRVYYQKQNTLTRTEENYGYFGVTFVSIIPEADQIQVVFRYNNSTLKNVAEDLGFDRNKFSREDDIFDVSLAISTDLTPDKADDNAYSAKEHPESVSEKRYFPTEEYTVKDTKNVYNYKKFVFEGVSVDELTLAVYVDIYYKGPDQNGAATVPNYEEKPMGTLIIYDYKSRNIDRKLSSDDIAAIKAFSGKN